MAKRPFIIPIISLLLIGVQVALDWNVYLGDNSWETAEEKELSEEELKEKSETEKEFFKTFSPDGNNHSDFIENHTQSLSFWLHPKNHLSARYIIVPSHISLTLLYCCLKIDFC